MKLFYLILLIISIVSCVSKTERTESITTSYSLELEEQIQETNYRMSLNQDLVYGHFDLALVYFVVNKRKEEFDTISGQGFEIKFESIDIRTYLDSNLVYNDFFATRTDTRYKRVAEYRDFCIELISGYSSSEYATERIIEILDIQSFERFSFISENQFRVEKELYKQRIYEVEAIITSFLLSCVEY